jgi:hypothetical protein
MFLKIQYVYGYRGCNVDGSLFLNVTKSKGDYQQDLLDKYACTVFFASRCRWLRLSPRLPFSDGWCGVSEIAPFYLSALLL